MKLRDHDQQCEHGETVHCGRWTHPLQGLRILLPQER
jgi:hypothetical protein